MICLSCNTDFTPVRSTAKFCSTACRVNNWQSRTRYKRPIKVTGKCHQRLVREKLEQIEPIETLTTPKGAVREIDFALAKEFILRYEWLGTMPASTRACYGLFINNDLAGVCVFSSGPGTRSGDLCGEGLREKAVCLARGACTHYAHPHTASYLISKAVKLASKEYGWQIFYAYSDPQAGEIGTVYQACNWHYLGQGVGRLARYRKTFTSPEGERYSERRFTYYRKSVDKTWSQLRRLGWRTAREWNKGRYVWFEGSRREKRELLDALRYPIKPYPKR